MTANGDVSYETYCLADRYFYDKPTRHPLEDTDFELTSRAVPQGWLHEPSDTWMYYVPDDLALPTQGWKIHVSSCLADAERVLETVWNYCIDCRLAVKFLRSKNVVVMFNSKSAFRGSSGKLVTVYPPDEARFQTVLEELDALLIGVDGPYILSDLRFREGPLYVRYGGFSERF